MKRRILIILLALLMLADAGQAMIGWPMLPRLETKEPIVIQPVVPPRLLPLATSLPAQKIQIMQQKPVATPKPKDKKDDWLNRLCLARVTAADGLYLYPDQAFKGEKLAHHQQGTLLYLHYHGPYCRSEEGHYVKTAELMLVGAVLAWYQGHNLAAPRQGNSLVIWENPDLSGARLAEIAKGEALGNCVELTGGISHLKLGFARTSDLSLDTKAVLRP